MPGSHGPRTSGVTKIGAGQLCLAYTLSCCFPKPTLDGVKRPESGSSYLTLFLRVPGPMVSSV